MYFGVMPWLLRSASACASASIRMPSRSSGMPTVLTPSRVSRFSPPLIAAPLHDAGIAGRQQRRVDEIERLQRAGDDHNVVGGAADAGVALQFCRQKFAQAKITLWPAGEPIGGERSALAPEHGAGSVDQALDRDLIRIVIAADKTVFCQPSPPGSRRGQSRGQQWRKVERRSSHGG